MLDRAAIDRQLRTHYDDVWRAGDAWEFHSSAYEQQRFAEQLRLLADRHYARALEIGCGGGQFTQMLATIADRVLALDVSAEATAQAKGHLQAAGRANVDLLTANVMEFDFPAEGPFDLIVLSETIYCLGWLYSFFDLAQLASNLLKATRPGGRLLLANTYGAERDWLLHPHLIDTYRDLFRNTGFQIEKEVLWRGVKHSQEFQALMSVCCAPTVFHPPEDDFGDVVQCVEPRVAARHTHRTS